MIALALFLQVSQPDQTQEMTWAIERGFEKVGEQWVSNAKDEADKFVLSIKDNPLLVSAWPSVGNGNLSFEVCAVAYSVDLSIDPTAFLDRVARRLKFTASDSTALMQDCAVYYEGLTAGQKSVQ